MKINLIELDKVESLLLISEQDLECAEILSNHKRYPNSIYLLFQSIEKTSKGLALMKGLFKFNELKDKVNHSPLRMCRLEILNNLKEAEKLEDAVRKNPELNEIPSIKSLDLSTFKKNAQFAEKILLSVMKKGKIFSDDIGELDIAINEMNKMIITIKRINIEEFNEIYFKQYKDAWTNSIMAYIKLSEEQGKHIDETEKEQSLSISDETLKMIADNVRKDLILEGIIPALSTTLNLLLSPHFKFLRYPDSKNPLEYYTDRNPLVMRLDKLIDIQKENVLFHKEYLEILKRIYSRIIIEE